MRDLTALALVSVIALALSPSVLAFDAAAFNEAAETILCDCGCHPQSVAACTCGRAAEMREEIRELVVSGMSGEQVIDDYVARYGEKILIAPEASGFNLLVWLGPLALLVLGVASLVLLVRRWSPRPSTEDSQPAAASVETDEPYLARLRREVEDIQ